MALHRLQSITLGVPNVADTARYYEEFGLGRTRTGGLATTDGGEQLLLRRAPRRRLEELRIECDDADDLNRIATNLSRLDIAFDRTATELSAVEDASGVRATVVAAARRQQPLVEERHYNTPGNPVRGTGRSGSLGRTDPVRPRQLGHVVVGSLDQNRTQTFFMQGIGFLISDEIKGRAAFLRCSEEHHNLLVQSAPVNFFHHSSWQVDDIDEIGRGAAAMLEVDPSRHVWGLGRHHVGSNFFWYLRDPAGNFSEYYSDMDCILEDQLWKPEVFEGKWARYDWGPPPPPSFIRPDDLTELMADLH
ncbi:dioxygenase [Pseudonocardia sp. GCM10023141]|uniref:dioxygenase n=1 Tax=Pseudonocardia sp. GCM10023141 TaxID=3252653 RepID=UPI00360E55DF